MEDRASTLRPALHHINLKTTRLQEMIDWYGTVVGMEVTYRFPLGAWLSNDAANHRIALLAFPGFTDDAEKERHTGMLHSAFEYPELDELLDSYRRLAASGIKPFMCLDHGMTMSFYYADPDGNAVELQVDQFPSWESSKRWMRDSAEFAADPIGVFVAPAALLAARDAGLSPTEIHERARRSEYLPDPLPDVPMPLPLR
jgi:catechol 2,3-dioxygenase